MLRIPIVQVQTNPLDVLLFGLGYRLAHLAKTAQHDDFNRLIAQKNVVLQWSSKDGLARFYTFANGTIQQTQGKAETADLLIDFKDSMRGAKILAKADAAALMQAIQDGDVVITGDYKLLLWFVGLVKIATQIPEPYKQHLSTLKPYLNQAKNWYQRAQNAIKK